MSTTLFGEKQWTDRANDMLKGRTIVRVRWLLKKEAEALGWYGRSVVIELDDGQLLFPSMDDEGNGPGALFTCDKDTPTLPVFGS